MAAADHIHEIVDVMKELCDDSALPRNVKAKFQEIMESLKKPTEISMKINKALHDLDEIGDDSNIQPFVRTQIWNIVSMLEKVNS